MERLKALYTLIKPSSSMCNMRCRYCFYEDESENRSQKNYGFMTRETASRLISSSVDATVEGSTISFGFQGGEPTLLGLDFFRFFIEEEKKYPGRVFQHSIQTNGYLIDEEWALFLKENNFLVGLSVDGYEALHDEYRVAPKGAPTFSRIAESARLLMEHDVPVNALCVVTKECAAKPHRVYHRLKAMGFRYLQFIPCLDPIGKERGQEPYSLLPEAFGSFLAATFDDWYRDWERGDYVSIRQFEDYVHLLLGEMPSSCTAFGRCGSYVVVEGDGSVYPCDFYVLDKYYEGNLNDTPILELATSQKARAFITEDVKRPDECGVCKRDRPAARKGEKQKWNS